MPPRVWRKASVLANTNMVSLCPKVDTGELHHPCGAALEIDGTGLPNREIGKISKSPV